MPAAVTPIHFSPTAPQGAAHAGTVGRVEMRAGSTATARAPRTGDLTVAGNLGPANGYASVSDAIKAVKAAGNFEPAVAIVQGNDRFFPLQAGIATLDYRSWHDDAFVPSKISVTRVVDASKTLKALIHNGTVVKPNSKGIATIPSSF